MGCVESSEVVFDRFLGVWYDLGGINTVSYTYSRLTLTQSGSLVFEEYDSRQILRGAYSGTVVALGQDKVQMTVSMPKGEHTTRYNILYVDYDSFALIESEDGEIARLLTRSPLLHIRLLPSIRKQAERVGWNYDLMEVHSNLIDRS